MKPDQAAKVLRRHNEWRRGADDNHWQQSPYSPAELGHAIDAAVAALEVAASAVPVAWRYQDANDNYRYRKYVSGFDVEYKLLRPVPLYAAPQPAYCCAKCGLAEMHPRERALHQDAKRGNFRQEDDGA